MPRSREKPTSRKPMRELLTWIGTDRFFDADSQRIDSEMARRYMFADESGCFNFSRGPNISRYYIVCTVTMASCEVANALLELRRELLWRNLPVGEYFHATKDKQPVRDAVFECLRGYTFRVQATIMEKSKAQPQTRTSSDRFYKYGWLYHFRYGIAKHISPDDELLITTASIGTRKGQAVFTDAVNDVVQQHLPRERWRTLFCQSASDPCLQVVDYCTWAIRRKWELADERSYRLISDRITYEYDLWKRGTCHYY